MSEVKKIYVADDSVVTRLFISNILENISGVEVLKFENGKEVLEAIQKEIPDVLILDSVMPEMDGITVLKNLKEQNLKVHVLFCTADIQTTTREKAMSLGIDDFLNKPIQKEVMLKKVKNLLNN